MGTVHTLSDSESEPPIDRDQFAAYLTMDGLADTTIRSYTAMMVRWVDFAIAHGHDPYRPGSVEVRAWSKTLQGNHSTLAHARSMIKKLCTALDVLDVSSGIVLPRQPKKIPRGLEPERVAKLMAAAEQSGLKGLAVMVGLYTAARRSEIASLAWRRCDLESRTVTLERRKVRDFHTVPMHPRLKELLEDRWVPGEVWVFAGRYGGHVAPAVIWEWVGEVSERAGIGHVTPHMLRHTALTAAYHATKDLRATQEFAGHTKVETTVRYTAVAKDRLNTAVHSLNYRAEDDPIAGAS